MRNRNWFIGIVFVLAAMFAIASQTQSFEHFGIMTIFASILLLAIVIHSIVRLNFFGIFLPLAFMYSIYQKPFGFADISIWLLVLSAVFAGIGFSIIFKSRPRRIRNMYDDKKGSHCSQTNENIDDNNPYAKVTFGSSSKYLHTDCLKGGQFYVSFGELEIYFDQAQLSPEGADIFIDCSFGAVRLFVPKHWRVVDKLNISLGGVDNNAYFANRDENSPTLTLTGNIQLGGIEIKYI